jgi:hypothetical protein
MICTAANSSTLPTLPLTCLPADSPHIHPRSVPKTNDHLVSGVSLPLNPVPILVRPLITVADKRFVTEQGDVLVVPVGAVHALRAGTDRAIVVGVVTGLT